MTESTKVTEVGPECVSIAKGEEWRTAAPGTNFVGKGTALDINVRVFAKNDTLHAAPNVKEEEIATILEGVFHIQADDESYELTVGEGIIIPPETDRVWTCLTPRGTLYRVLTLDQPEQPYTVPSK